MWWEALPSAAIIGLCIGVAPQLLHTAIHKVILGKWMRRPRRDRWDVDFFYRDADLTGFAYDTRGLDGIPDASGAGQHFRQNKEHPWYHEPPRVPGL